MSKITLVSPASGTAEFSITTPSGTSTDRTLTLPDAGGTVVSDTATQTLTNKTLQGGALTIATAVTASGTSVDFINIPSWVKRITVMFSGVSTSGASVTQVQIGSGSFTTSGYACQYSTNGLSGTLSTGFITSYRADGGNALRGLMQICLVSGATYVESSVIGGGASDDITSGSGAITLGGVLDRIRITTIGGTDTFDAGTINIMYEG